MIELLIIAVCLVFNGILSGLEMAFVSVSKPYLRDLAKSGNREAKKILEFRERPERTLSVLQIGITLVGALAATVGGASAEELLRPLLEQKLGLSNDIAQVLSVLAVVIPYTYLSVVFGELVPKCLALRNPAPIVLKSARWLRIFDRLFSPVVSLLEASTRKLLNIFKIVPHSENDHRSGEPFDLEGLSQEHRQFVFNLVEFRKKVVRDVLLPWKQVISADISQPASEILQIVYTSGHTRLPVVNNGTPIGILNTKEFLLLRATGSEDWTSIVRPLIEVHESDSLLRALTVMQEKRSHISVVISPADKMVGIVAMEDIFEEIIGDIYDEDDDGKLRRILAASRRGRFHLSA